MFRIAAIADDSWDKPLSIQAHDMGVNCVSWASVNSGNDYFVSFRNVNMDELFWMMA